MRTQLICLAMLLVLITAGCVAPAAQPTPNEEPPPAPTAAPPPAPTAVPPAAVVMGMAERYNAGDLAGAMAYWADDGIFYMFGMPPNGSEIAAGQEGIRAVFEENIASHSRMEVEIGTVLGDVVNTRMKTWHDFTRQIGAAPLEANGVYVVKDGKIASHTWILTPDSAAKLKTAMAEAMAGEPPAEAEAPAPAETPVSEVAVTFSDGTCRYDGPLALQPGEVKVTVDVQDQDRAAYAVTFLTLDPDRDFMDLMASAMGPPPLGSLLLYYEEVGAGERNSYNITVTEGPVYAVCWSKPPDLPIGNIGPFSVAQPEEAEPPEEAPKSDIVVTFAGGVCKYEGPPTLRAGELTVTVEAKDRDKEAYAAAWFTLAPEKTLRNLLDAQDSPSPPPWADMLALQEAPPGGSETYTLKVEKGPLYLLCWAGSPDHSSGVGSKGPLEVTN
jgi:hypothetical protein